MITAGTSVLRLRFSKLNSPQKRSCLFVRRFFLEILLRLGLVLVSDWSSVLRCTRKQDCSRSSEENAWLWSPSQQCVEIQSFTPPNLSCKKKQQVGPAGTSPGLEPAPVWNQPWSGTRPGLEPALVWNHPWSGTSPGVEPDSRWLVVQRTFLRTEQSKSGLSSWFHGEPSWLS